MSLKEMCKTPLKPKALGYDCGDVSRKSPFSLEAYVRSEHNL
jgi:hypothetical protein